MNNQISKRFASSSWILILTILTIVVVSCNDELGSDSKQSSPEISAATNAELVMATQDVMEITGSGMNSQGITYGRAAAHGGDGDYDKNRLCGAIISKNFNLNSTMPDSLVLSGSITIDFGDGTHCPDSANRFYSGKITSVFTINVNLKNHLYTSSETVTLEDFKHGSKVLSGVFHAQAASGGMCWLDITNAKLVSNPEDDEENMNSEPTTITWGGSLTLKYNNKGTLAHNDDTRTLTGSITGTTNNGTFTSEIVEEVTFKASCFFRRNIPVRGIVNISSGGVLTVVDFGDGSCDKLYTTTTLGTTTELHF